MNALQFSYRSEGDFITRHRLAIIGLGHWGRKYVRVATALEATVVVCHRRRRGNDASWLAEEHPTVRHTASLSEAFEYRLDAVVIVTPRQSNAALTLECLRRGLHVLVEKPAATTVEDVERTHEEARARGLVLHTGYTHRFDAGLQRLGELARRAVAPNWRLTWHNPLRAAPLHVTRGPSDTASVAVDLPTGAGIGHVEVASDTTVKHKTMQLCDGLEIVAEWSDRRLWDLRQQHIFEAPAQPLTGQLRTFLDAIRAPSERPDGTYALDRLVTESLVQFTSKHMRFINARVINAEEWGLHRESTPGGQSWVSRQRATGPAGARRTRGDRPGHRFLRRRPDAAAAGRAPGRDHRPGRL